MSRLKDKYQTIKPQLQKDLGLSNLHEVPQLEKVVLNVGLGRVKDNKKAIETAKTTLRKITAQEPVATTAKQSIAGFNLREGEVAGVKVTLRGRLMYDFLDRLISIVLPRTRDFRGLNPKAFDGQGNYSLGLRDQSAFAELDYEDMEVSHGLQINIITSTFSNEKSYQLLKKLGLPFAGTKEETSG